MTKKETYTAYKNENRVEKNKIRKLEKHCRRFPNDEMGKKNLERIKKDGYKPRSKPIVPGSNSTTSFTFYGKLHHIDTPAEQLSKLLGVPLLKSNKPKKLK